MREGAHLVVGEQVGRVGQLQPRADDEVKPLHLLRRRVGAGRLRADARAAQPGGAAPGNFRFLSASLPRRRRCPGVDFGNAVAGGQHRVHLELAAAGRGWWEHRAVVAALVVLAAVPLTRPP